MKKVLKVKNCLAFLLIVVLSMLLLSCTSRGGFQELEQTNEMHIEAIRNLRRFKINGAESSNDWIELKNERLSVTGFVNRSSYSTYYNDYQQFMMFVPEEVEGITVYHVIYFVETPNTKREIVGHLERDDGFSDAIIDLCLDDDARRHVLPAQNDHLLTQLTFSIHDGWIRAEHVREYRNVFYGRPDSISPINSDAAPRTGIMRQELRNIDIEDSFWLDVSEGEVFELSGASNGGGSGAQFARVPARLGSAVIYHFVRVEGLNFNTGSSGNFTVPVTLSDGALVRVR